MEVISEKNINIERRIILVYLSLLVFLVSFISPTGNFIDIGVSFLLKNQLHASSLETANFRLLCSLPVYFGFLFGLIRDFWNPFQLRDRGIFALMMPPIAFLYCYIALSELSFGPLLAQLLIVTCFYKLILAASHALVALIAQERKMTGQLSALLLIVKNLPEIIGAALSTYILKFSPQYLVFLIVALCAAGIGVFSFWKPQAVYKNLYQHRAAQTINLFQDVRRLACHRPIYPVLIMLLMFDFAPGFNTPLQYHLSNNLGASDAIYGHFLTIFYTSLIPGFFFYSFLVKRVCFNKLLWWSMCIAVPQMLLLGFINSGTMALILSVPMGLVAGLAYSALYDLAIRSCPHGLHGSFMMLVAGALALSDRGSNVLGAIIFDTTPVNGLMYCAILTTCVYACIIPIIFFIPKSNA